MGAICILLAGTAAAGVTPPTPIPPHPAPYSPFGSYHGGSSYPGAAEPGSYTGMVLHGSEAVSGPGPINQPICSAAATSGTRLPAVYRWNSLPA